MQFDSWPYFLLLLVIPIFHRAWMRRNRPAKIKLPVPLDSSVRVANPLRWLFIIRYLAIISLVFALARPQNEFRQAQRDASGIDIMLVLDVSASMNAEDLAENSRLEVAKETMRNFVKGRQSDRIGLVVFSGEPFTLAPPTLDYGLVLESIRGVEIGELKDGTAIGDGLSLAVNRLRNSKAKSRVVILLTDGDNNIGQVDPATAGELAKGYGIKVYTIAVGKEGRVRIPIKRRGAFGNEIVTYQYLNNALNPELLQHIAALTEGKFYRVTDEDNLKSVFNEIDQFEKSNIEAKEKIHYSDAYERPLKLGLILLLIEKFLALGWWRFAL